MPTVFERRRLATTAKMAALVASFDAGWTSIRLR